MKWIVLLAIILLLCGLSAAQTAAVTQCEWFTGPDPGAGLGHPITVGSPSGLANLSFPVSTGSIAPGIIKIKLRCRADSVRSNSGGVWAAVTDAFLVVSPALSTVRLATQFDYRIDNGSWITVNPADAASLDINETVATAGLAFGLHKIAIRLYDDLNRLGAATIGYFFAIDPANPGQIRLVTRYEYRIDNGSWNAVDIPDAAMANIVREIPTAGLTFGLHRLDMRPADDLNRTGAVTNGYFFIVDTANPPVARLVTQIQYWFNSNSPTILDLTDSPSVNLDQVLATAGLPIGLNRLSLQAIDDLGRLGPVTSNNLIVTSPFGPGAPRTVAAAEYFMNADPGAGNGVSIPLPVDGVFDENQEEVAAVITGLPIGLHLVGIRTQDDAGRWSAPITDSLIVGPILTVHAVGGDVVLDWQVGSGADLFYIFRSGAVSGPYALTDSTAANSWTDTGIANTQARQFYRVSFRSTTVSSFRLPEPQPDHPQDR
jgi:hypothetical protein